MSTRPKDKKRSEQVRRRRSQRTIKRNERSTRRRKVASGTSLPPMIVRMGPSTGAAMPKRSAKTRRRFDIPLSTPGAEIRLPAVPHIRLGWRLLSGILVVLLLSMLYTLWNSPIYKINAAEVVGLHRLTVEEINTVLKVSGQPVFAVEPVRLQQDLQEAFPELYNISIKVQFPAEVLVSVDERQPVLAWQQDGVTLWVDGEGMAFPPHGEADLEVSVEASDAPAAPSVGAGGQQPFLGQEMLAAIQTVRANAPEGTAILFDREHGLGWRDPQGWQVYFGPNPQQMTERMAVYRAILEYLQQQKIEPAMISVEQLHAPYFRMDR